MEDQTFTYDATSGTYKANLYSNTLPGSYLVLVSIHAKDTVNSDEANQVKYVYIDVVCSTTTIDYQTGLFDSVQTHAYTHPVSGDFFQAFVMPAYTEMNSNCFLNNQELRTYNDNSGSVITNLIIDNTTFPGQYIIYDPSAPFTGQNQTFYIWN